ncbi:MAG: amino acid adenylation domain-containing protein [Hyphomicrobiales bacterium]|nr:amino acid adenylation domain-containing protein [Hyphomicrobiales bacterium]
MDPAAFRLPTHTALWQTSRFNRHAISHLSEDDQALFEIFGHGPLVRPRHGTIHSGFECYAAEQPDAVAVRHLGSEITYGELDAQSNRLARILLSHDVGRGDAVALYLQRSIEMVVGIMAILKTGAAYIPQHVGVAPKETLEHIADVTGAKVVLALSELSDQLPPDRTRTCFAIDDVMAPPIHAGDAAPVRAEPAQPHDPCLILFTSGTTGVPNGVQVTHRNMCNILQTAPGDLGIRPGMKVAQLLSIAFDMAAWEILGCLTNGGTLVIRGNDFQEAAEQVDVIIATPSILCSIDAARCRNVKVAAVTGEPCPRSLADTWSSFSRFYNSCGPTETTIINTAEPHYPMKPVLSIGRPTPNNTVYVLDENLRPCKIGEVGEMWAGGDCVTAGYLANEKLTGDRYRPDPFLGGGRMMFRTRDLGRWTANGELEHFGRVDDQVKIRGFRVELDAVSSVLEAVEGCEQAVTLKYDNRNLVSFVSPETVDIARAEDAVAEKLPYCCVPAFIIALNELPRTPRGKIDKRLLMKMAVDHHGKSNVRVA